MESTQYFDLKEGRASFSRQSEVGIMQLLGEGHLSFAAQIRETGRRIYSPMLMSHDFGAKVARRLRLAASGPSQQAFFNSWEIHDRGTAFGPFSLLQMLEFYYRKRINEKTLVMHPYLAEPLALGETCQMALRSREAMMQSPEIRHLVTRRRHPRIRYDNEAFVSSSGEIYRGVTWSLSSGGLGLVTDQSTKMDLNSTVNVIINSNNDHASIQVRGQVVNIRKETNYERIALEFAEEHELLSDYINNRIPSVET